MMMIALLLVLNIAQVILGCMVTFFALNTLNTDWGFKLNVFDKIFLNTMVVMGIIITLASLALVFINAYRLVTL
jgi:hypothetical protein